MTASTTDDTQRTARRDRLLGIGLMCGALLCFSCLDTTAKYLGRELPTLQVVWARYFSNVAIVLMVINPVTQPGVLRSRRIGLQIFRSFLLLASTILNFWALRYLQLGEAISINFMLPLLVAILAVPMLGERLERNRMGAILVGFAGVLIVTRPGLGGMHPAALLCVIGCICYAFYGITTRILSTHDSSATTLVYSGFVGVALLTPILPFLWQQPASTTTWLFMASMGIYAALGHYLLIVAYKKAPAAVVAPFIYTQLLWMNVLGYLVFGDVPDRYTLLGGLVVAGSGLYLLFMERRKA
ncbi:DMT family transporter [uncultured Alsobacter sp.]|uniref:DMT family transporter n=1 Tax=uncultured Alsobacter sp. TaxID=1748258 RepID=UPI0025F4BDF8|nr:DMT family transporter [uncultured Alsobacter sp.]